MKTLFAALLAVTLFTGCAFGAIFNNPFTTNSNAYGVVWTNDPANPDRAYPTPAINYVRGPNLWVSQTVRGAEGILGGSTNVTLSITGGTGLPDIFDVYKAILMGGDKVFAIGTNGTTYGNAAGMTNLAGGTVSGALLSTASTATNNPAENELVAAQWVRTLLSAGGQFYYPTTNLDGLVTNNTRITPVYQFQSIPFYPSARLYASPLTNNQYIGAVVTTNKFQSLSGPVVVQANMSMTGGVGGPSITVHPELYYTYDGSNWLGDFEAPNQTITTGTNLYQWAINFPAFSATNTAGFWVVRAYKVGAVGGATAPGITFNFGTNFQSYVSIPTPPQTTIVNTQIVNNLTVTNATIFNGKTTYNTNVYNYYLNSRAQDVTWTGPTNYLSYTNGTLQSYEASVPVSVTNVYDETASYGNPILLCISNASPTNITVVTPAAYKMSSGNVGPWTVTNGNILEVWFFSSQGRKTVISQQFQ